MDHLLLHLEVIPSPGLETLHQDVVVSNEEVAQLDEGLLIHRCLLDELLQFPVHRAEHQQNLRVQLATCFFVGIDLGHDVVEVVLEQFIVIYVDLHNLVDVSCEEIDAPLVLFRLLSKNVVVFFDQHPPRNQIFKSKHRY
jgi:hypothetical protein